MNFVLICINSSVKYIINYSLVKRYVTIFSQDAFRFSDMSAVQGLAKIDVNPFISHCPNALVHTFSTEEWKK